MDFFVFMCHLLRPHLIFAVFFVLFCFFKFSELFLS